jgi:hypothetical protein
MAFVTSVTGAQLYYCLCCCNFAHHSIVARSNFFWLFVTKMRGRRDDNVRLRRLYVGKQMLQARSQEVTQKLQTDFVDIAGPYLTMTTADDVSRL